MWASVTEDGSCQTRTAQATSHHFIPATSNHYGYLTIYHTNSSSPSPTSTTPASPHARPTLAHSPPSIRDTATLSNNGTTTSFIRTNATTSSTTPPSSHP